MRWEVWRVAEMMLAECPISHLSALGWPVSTQGPCCTCQGSAGWRGGDCGHQSSQLTTRPGTPWGPPPTPGHLSELTDSLAMQTDCEDAALDMTISRAGHTEIPLARIEKRVRSGSESQTSRGRIEHYFRYAHKPVRLRASFYKCLYLQAIINFIITLIYWIWFFPFRNWNLTVGVLLIISWLTLSLSLLQLQSFATRHDLIESFKAPLHQRKMNVILISPVLPSLTQPTRPEPGSAQHKKCS